MLISEKKKKWYNHTTETLSSDRLTINNVRLNGTKTECGINVFCPNFNLSRWPNVDVQYDQINCINICDTSEHMSSTIVYSDCIHFPFDNEGL